MQNNQDQLARLAQEIEDSNVCPDLKANARLVFGFGNPEAEVVFIGEAPGKQEDIQGKPFVGAAGKFLDVMLQSVQMDRSDVYITNIVKYRPPENRDPLKSEKIAFIPYLEQELRIIKPKLVITLGRHSMEYFIPDETIGEIHGQPRRVQFGEESLVVMPLYHPSAAAYNPKLRPTLLEDFQKVPQVIENIDSL